MSKKVTKIFALFLILAMLCTGCGLSGAPADSGTSAPAATDGAQSGTDAPNAGSTDVKVGLEQNVYEIPDYTNNAPEGTKVVRMSVSMGAGDYGVSASGVMFKTFVDRLEELSGGKMVAQVFPANQLASTSDDIINGLTTNAFEFDGTDHDRPAAGGYRHARCRLHVSGHADPLQQLQRDPHSR